MHGRQEGCVETKGEQECMADEGCVETKGEGGCMAHKRDVLRQRERGEAWQTRGMC